MILAGQLVRLEPLSLDHVPGLAQAAQENRDSYGFTKVPLGEQAMAAHVSELLVQQTTCEVIPFAQLVQSRPVGMTRYLTLRPHAIEIGGTWLAASAQRSGVNVEAKLLLLGHAFEELGMTRVDLKTDARNQRSREAIAALGATFEGVLRCWQPSLLPGEEGLFRDSAMFSVLRQEWPTVQEQLRLRLSRSVGNPRT